MANTRFYIWEGIYSDFDDAQVDLTGRGFESKRYIDQSRRAMEESLEHLRRNENLPLFHKQRFTLLPTTLSLLSRFGSSRSSFKLTDFGGGFGLGYLNCLQDSHIGKQHLDYSVVDLPEVISAASLFSESHNLELRFYESLDDIKETDLIFCSSAIQYVHDWRFIINQFCRLNPKVILMADVFCGSFPTFATLQNYYDSKIPHWFLNFKELCDEFITGGYELASKSVSTGIRAGSIDLLPMDNFPDSHRLPSASHLVFVKAKPL